MLQIFLSGLDLMIIRLQTLSLQLTQYSSSNGLPLTNPTLYRTIVGSLVYLTITRPDIAYIVYVVSQFVASPTTIHWTTILCILQYL
jgi:hypothetical protein